MGATWIVSANAGRARFFSQSAASEALEEVNNMVNDAARLRTEESQTDRLGPRAAGDSIHSVGGATPTSLYEPAKTPQEHQSEIFARDIAGFLTHAHQEGGFQKLSLIASPQFLGLLRKELEPKFSAMIELQIDKDYTQYSAPQLLEALNAARAKQREKPDE